ncbi:MAG: hypothetical protein WCI49_13110 [Ferruginibacter sp.]
MKQPLLILLTVIFLGLHSRAQSIHVKFINTTTEDNTEVDISNSSDIELDSKTKDLKSITVNCKDLPAGHKLTITVAGETKEYSTPGVEKKLDFSNNILNKEVTIQHFNNNAAEVAADKMKFHFIPEVKNPTTTNTGNTGENILQKSIADFLATNYSNLESTPFGYINPSEKERRIHIFFDNLGNSLLSTIPSGISNAQYVVHIIYPFSLSEPDRVSYSVKQKSGSFSSALLFNNNNIRSDIPGILQAGEKIDGITERNFLLGTATDDLTFDIIEATRDTKVTKTVLETYTIKMSPVYHGSFDVGLIKTDLSNPNFNLVQLPGSTNQVVKQTDESPKGVVTVMASFYVSPVVLLESLLGKNKIPFYKLTGRSFLDDHKFYERFYPTIGVGVSDKAFENLFYGINWELARGLSIFGGWHYGKVRTFGMPNFKAGVTPVTNTEFDFYQNTKWEKSTAIGVKLDIMIVKNLFGTVAGSK